jgi:hypothetical protein
MADREPEVECAWLEDAVADLRLVGMGSLRGFLRECGAQVVGGRELFAPLCELHRAVQAGSDEVSDRDVARAIDIMDGPLAAVDAQGIRGFLVATVAARADHAQSKSLEFAMRNIEYASEDALPLVERQLGTALWARDPAALGELLSHERGPHHDVAVSAISSMASEEILTGLQRTPSLSSRVLALRRELLSDPILWKARSPWLGSALELAFEEPTDTAAVLEAMLEACNPELPGRVRGLCKPEAVVRVLIGRLERRCAQVPNDLETQWLQASLTPNALALVLSRGDVTRVTTMHAVSRLVDPDYVPNDYGEDPVFAAIRGCRGELSETPRMYLAAWLLSRALGSRSRSAAELITVSLDDVYRSVLASRISAESWSLLARRLPNSALWGDWDKARRVRVGVVNAFVDRGLSPAAFGVLLDEDLFAHFAQEARGMMFTGGFLKRVRRALRGADSVRYASRIAILR